MLNGRRRIAAAIPVPLCGRGFAAACVAREEAPAQRSLERKRSVWDAALGSSNFSASVSAVRVAASVDLKGRLCVKQPRRLQRQTLAR